MKKLRVTVDGKAYEVVVEEIDTGGQAASPAPAASASSASVAPPVTTQAPRAAAPTAGAGAVACPLSGRVVSIDCTVGQTVEEGDKLVTLEAMKMNTIVFAHGAGTVKEILVAAGDAVEEGQGLIVIQ